jgi:hypothetical protein
LWEKAGDAGPQKIRDFAKSYVNRGEERKCLEIAEDLYCDTIDQDLKKKIEGFINHLKVGLFVIDQSLDDLHNDKSSRSKQSATQEKAIKTIDDLKTATEDFRKVLDLEIKARTVRSRLELKANKFRIVNGSPGNLPHSIVKSVKVDIELTMRQTSNLEDCILEERVFRGGETRGTAYADIKDLGRILGALGESEGVLSFAGFQILPQTFPADLSIKLVFLFPKNYSHPRSLRDLLLTTQDTPTSTGVPRNFRFILPKQLARAVFSVHSRNLVHKDIRPETLLHFDDASRGQFPNKIGNAYLTGWQMVRKTTDVSSRQFRLNEWAAAMYQHPSRQKKISDNVVNFKHTVGHDIYSLGVCLLELGLWKSFVAYREDGSATKSPILLEYERLWKAENPVKATSSSSAEIERMAFFKMAGQPLAYEMGNQYSELVLKCLTCLEKGFGNDHQFADNASDDWKEEGVQFIQRVIQDLHRASQMDIS